MEILLYSIYENKLVIYFCLCYVEICYIRTHFATCSLDPNYHILGVSSIKCHHMQCTELMENLDVFVNIQRIFVYIC